MTLETYRSSAIRSPISRIRQTLKNECADPPENQTEAALQFRQCAAGTRPSATAPRNHRGRAVRVAHNCHNLKQIREKIELSIEKAARKHNLSPTLLHAMVKAESNYEVRAVSPAGARGLMQLMPETARDLGVTNPFDIDQNINGGAQYMRWMIDRFNGNLKLALAAYNAGPETVSRHGGQVPPYSETRTYIQRVMRHTNEHAG